MVPGLWQHKWRPVQFTLVVDYFGVKYVGEKHALHLKHTLEENYTVTKYGDGKMYIVITLDWDYTRRQVHLSMLGYVKKALKQFGHTLQKNRTSRTQASQSSIEKRNSTQRNSQPHRYSIRKVRNTFRKYVENAYFLGE